MSQISSQRTTRQQQKIDYYALGQDGTKTKDRIVEEKIQTILKEALNNSQQQPNQIEQEKYDSNLQKSSHKNDIKRLANAPHRINLESSQQKEYFYGVDFARVYHDQPSLLKYCCWICLEITPKCMYQCSKCGMYLCNQCKILSAVSDKCYHCSSLSTSQMIKGDTRQTLQDTEFSCKHNKHGCTVRKDSSQLQNHEKLCEFSIQDKREQLRGMAIKEEKKNKENKRIALLKKDNQKKSRDSNERQSQKDDGEGKRQSQEIQPKMERKQPISKGRTSMNKSINRSFGSNKSSKVKITAF